jgi:hypothetical protein
MATPAPSASVARGTGSAASGSSVPSLRANATRATTLAGIATASTRR